MSQLPRIFLGLFVAHAALAQQPGPGDGPIVAPTAPEAVALPAAPIVPNPSTQSSTPTAPVAPASDGAVPAPTPLNGAEAPAPAAPPEAGAATAPETAVERPTSFSYGTYPHSILFTDATIETLKAILRANENQEPMAIDSMPDMPVPVELPQTPQRYPVFSLGSIAYRSAADWTVWLNGVRITPRTNTQEVRVISVHPSEASFTWQPAYIQSLQLRHSQGKFASTKPVSHKTTATNQSAFDGGDHVSFRLKPNQSFSPGYMATFEGTIASPELEPLTTADTPVPETIDPAAAAADTSGAGAGTTKPEEEFDGFAGDAVKELYDKAGEETEAVRRKVDRVEAPPAAPTKPALPPVNP